MVYLSFFFRNRRFFGKTYRKHIPVILGYMCVYFFVFISIPVEAFPSPPTNMSSEFCNSGNVSFVKLVRELRDSAVWVLSEVENCIIKGIQELNFGSRFSFDAVREAKAEKIHNQNPDNAKQEHVRFREEDVKENHAEALKFLSIGMWFGLFFSWICRYYSHRTSELRGKRDLQH